MASRISVPAMTPRKLFHGSGGAGCGRPGSLTRVPSEQGARRARGDDRAGDDDARCRTNAVVVARLLDQCGGGLDGVGQRLRR